MCGICGKWNFDGQPVSEAELRRMCQSIAHRGPDGEGVFLEDGIGLGNRRLSIIDLETGDQPIANEDRSIWIVFNGEIYNFQELRSDLQRRGHHFYTLSDTEVIVHLYEEYGRDCVKHLRGMFAFALWDKKKERLLLARDRVGKKPLFYRLTSTSLAFGSEIKTILTDPNVPRELDVLALHYYLTYQYVPPPYTIFKGINKLPPAHTLICEKGQVSIEPYWQLDFTKKTTLSESEIVELHELISESVRLRLISDVPLGTFLSGGIDSSLVVAYMSQFMDQPVKTFSIGFEEDAFDELPYARTIAERFGTEHHEFIVRPDAIEVLPELVWHFDEPFADSSALPTYYVSKVTSEFVKVALNGDGGDESFVGYERYLGLQYVRNYQLLPQIVREKLIGKISARLAAEKTPGAFFRRLHWLNSLSLLPKDNLYSYSMTMFRDEMQLSLYSQTLRRELENIDTLDYMLGYMQDGHAYDLLDQMQYADMMAYLPGDLLVKVDRMAMAHSLEGRSPFLDHKLMEFAATIPVDIKFKHRKLKYILKKTGAELLPASILNRRKMGFGVPISHWFRTSLKRMMQNVLDESRLVAEGYFEQDAVMSFWDEHIAGRADHSYRLWTLLMLELWYRCFIDRQDISNLTVLSKEREVAGNA
jgi:asparagine synthase (glutamine-hydrolysing)